MFRNHIKYIKEYFKVAEMSKPLFGLTLLTAVIYKGVNVARPVFAALIIEALTQQDAGLTYLYIAIYTIIYVLYRLTLFLNYKAYSWNVSYVYKGLQTRIFNKLIDVDADFTKRISKGKLMNTINSDVIALGEMNDEISEYFTTMVQIVVVLVICATHSLLVTVVIMVSIAIQAVGRDEADIKYNYFWGKTQRDNDKYSTFLGQVVAGLSEVKTFNMLPQLRQNLGRIQRHYDKLYKQQRHFFTIRDNDVQLWYYVVNTMLYAVLVYMMARGQIGVDILVLLVAYHEQAIRFANDFTDAATEIRLDNISVRRVQAILSYRAGQPLEFGDLDLDHLQGVINLKHVSLTINQRKILQDINLRIDKHRFTAIVGFPGAGKTMLFNLILRLQKPTHGRILLDNINIYDFSKEVYTSNVAVANQTPFIFNMSIRKNLDFVDPDIRHQIEACKIAGIHDFIETLPQGYNTVLRENASNVSGGQRQMISIARTVLTDAEVLLLDDVTTSLDPDTAKLVPRFINKVKDTHTVVMITKKPELMREADRIIVLDRGRVADSGTHEQLLKRSRLYREIYAAKSGSGWGEHV